MRNKTRCFSMGLGLALLLGAALPAPAGAAGYETNGLPDLAPPSTYTSLSARAKAAMDTNLANGRSPQTVGVEAFRIAAHSMQMQANQATSTAGTATLNTLGGMVTTEALTTAVGATYVFTLVNSNLQPAPAPQLLVSFHSKTNTGGQASAGAIGLQVVSIVQTSGQAVITIQNNGTAPLNGTMLLGFHI